MYGFVSFRMYLNPKQVQEIISYGVELPCMLQFQKTLLQRVFLSATLSAAAIPFRHDVFQYLFRGKGKKSQDLGNLLLEKQDFFRCSFPRAWDKLLGTLGDVIKADFPKKQEFVFQEAQKTILRVRNQMFYPQPDIVLKS